MDVREGRNVPRSTAGPGAGPALRMKHPGFKSTLRLTPGTSPGLPGPERVRCRPRPAGGVTRPAEPTRLADASQWLSKLLRHGRRKATVCGRAHPRLFSMAVVYSLLLGAGSRRISQRENQHGLRATKRSTDSVTLWLRRGRLAATLAAFQFTTTVDSYQPVSYRRTRAFDPPSERSSTARACCLRSVFFIRVRPG